ncbi:putative reverse transcriptase domain-containing protein [Tanacetum coccineum]
MSSDSASSEVTYTSISSHGDPLAWAVDFFRLQEPDSPEAAPASPDYVSGPEEPEQASLSPNYVPGPEYPEYLAPSDEEVPVEDQPYAVADSPIALSPGYVADSDPEEDPEEDSEDGPVDYPADGGDGNDDDSSDDDDKKEEASEEEEDEHLALADPVVAPVVDHVPSSEETNPFETDESAATPPSPPACRTTARISIQPEAPMPFPSEKEFERLFALPPPPPSPLISLSPPSAEERLARCLAAPALPSSPLSIVPYPNGSPNHVRAPPGFRDAIGRLRASSPSTHHPLHPSPPLPPPSSSLHLPPPVPTSLPLPSSPLPPLPASLFIPPPVDRREDTPDAELPPRKRLCLTALTSRYEVGESSTAAPRPAGGHGIDYGFIGTLDAETRRQRAEEVDYGIRDVWVDPIEAVEEDRQTQLFQRVDGLVEDRQFYYETARLLDQEALNNMPPRRSSATARVVVAARAVVAAATPMTAAAVEQLIKERVSAALANHETLRNSTNCQGDGSHNSDTGTRGTVHTPCECTYKDFLNCKPLSFKGTEGVVVLSQWFKKMESVFHISNCANSHMKTVTQDVAYAMDWKALKKMMTVKYCPRGCIYVWKDVPRGIEVERYVGEFPDMISGECDVIQPKTMEKAIEGTNNKTRRQNTGRAYTAGRSDRYWLVTVGVWSRQFKNNNRGRNSGATQNAITCYECGVQGHYKKNCPKLKNGNCGNQLGNDNAPAKDYVVGNAGTNPDSNVVTGTFLLNDRYASILFATLGANRSLVICCI